LSGGTCNDVDGLTLCLVVFYTEGRSRWIPLFWRAPFFSDVTTPRCEFSSFFCFFTVFFTRWPVAILSFLDFSDFVLTQACFFSPLLRFSTICVERLQTPTGFAFLLPLLPIKRTQEAVLGRLFIFGCDLYQEMWRSFFSMSASFCLPPQGFFRLACPHLLPNLYVDLVRICCGPFCVPSMKCTWAAGNPLP